MRATMSVQYVCIHIRIRPCNEKNGEKKNRKENNKNKMSLVFPRESMQNIQGSLYCLKRMTQLDPFSAKKEI